MEEGNAEAAILAWLQRKIDEMSDRELAKFRDDLLLNHLLDIYDFLEKLEKRDRVTVRDFGWSLV